MSKILNFLPGWPGVGEIKGLHRKSRAPAIIQVCCDFVPRKVCYPDLPISDGISFTVITVKRRRIRKSCFSTSIICMLYVYVIVY